MTEIVKIEDKGIFKTLITGDISKFTEEEKINYYMKLCESLGLNPYTRPFEYLTFDGKHILYAKKDATEQLRVKHGISIEKLETQRLNDVYIVTAYAKDSNGRTDISTGVVSLNSYKGEALTGDRLANAVMKAETKAKRRVTLSIAGLGMLDETELETMKDITPKTKEEHDPLISSKSGTYLINGKVLNSTGALLAILDALETQIKTSEQLVEWQKSNNQGIKSFLSDFPQHKEQFIDLANKIKEAQED